MQMMNFFFLAADDPVHQIADREDTDDGLLAHHRQMSDPAVGHQTHTIVDTLIESRNDRRAGHDLAHGSFARSLALQDHLPCVIALGEDAAEIGVVHHQHRADIFIRHDLQRLVNRHLRRNGADADAFVVENRAHSVIQSHYDLRVNHSLPGAGVKGVCIMAPMRIVARIGVTVWLLPALALSQSGFDAAVRTGERMPRLHSLLASRRGEVILEHYFHGTRATSFENVKSASKSVISALVGIAIDRKLLPGVNAPIAPYRRATGANARDARKSKITIEDLLTMRSGLVDTNRGYGAWVQSPNWVRYLLTRPLQQQPGEPMNYNTGNTHLLSAILTKVSGSDTWTFAQKALGAPLGIALAKWPRDPQGILRRQRYAAHAWQMLRFGELYLHRGYSGDRQVVPSSWVEESWVPRTRSLRSGQLYGYGWWITELAGRTVEFAWGFGGQYIFIVPSLDLVVVTTSSVAPGDDRREYLAGSCWT